MTESKLDDRLTDSIALFSVYRHTVSGLLAFYYEKTFRDRGSGFVVEQYFNCGGISQFLENGYSLQTRKS